MYEQYEILDMYVRRRIETHVECLSIVGTCATALDIVLVLDQSTSITEPPGGHGNWYEDVLGFVKGIAGAFFIGRNQTQIGLMKFSDLIEIVFHLNAYSDRGSVLNATNVAISGGQTHIDVALRTARETMFTRQNGSRPGVPKVLILLTDGAPNNDPGNVNTLAEANLIKAANIKIYTVGVGYQVDDNLLRQIASVPECFFFAENFTRLDSVVEQIVENLCRETAATTTSTSTTVTPTTITATTMSTTTTPKTIPTTTTSTSTTTTSQLIGPLYTSATYLGTGPYTDFYFICRVSYRQLNEQANFEVTLTFDSQLSNVTKTITSSSSSSSVDVIFTSKDVSAGFGTQVSFSCVFT